MKGNIHSIEPLGCFDGPGLRFVVFFQGCGWKCIYCHNRDTWSGEENKLMTPEEIFAIYQKYEHFYQEGGITLSGGEPLIQIDFVIELLTLFKSHNIHTTIDTSAQNFSLSTLDKYEQVIALCDLFLLDIKQINTPMHHIITGFSNDNSLNFCIKLSLENKPTIIRYVLVKGYSDNLDDVINLRKFLDQMNNVIRVDVLSYHNLGSKKYSALGIPYTLSGANIPSKEQVEEVNKILNK
jgi:pyruvate formate lyase activating enzyme